MLASQAIARIQTTLYGFFNHDHLADDEAADPRGASAAAPAAADADDDGAEWWRR